MYELLKSYEGIGKRVFDIEELKQILGVDDKYTKYANFKKRILLKAQRDLAEHTDIRFSFEEISESSRRVEKIAFKITRNVPSDMPLQEQAKHDGPEWVSQLKALGISEQVLQ